MADEALFALARRAVEGEELGADEIPDLLTVSASAFDAIGHRYGPESHEALDALLRLDAALASFFAFLDGHVGAGQYVVVFSADHGVQPTPARLTRNGVNAGMVDVDAVAKSAEAALVAAFGPGPYLTPFIDIGFSFLDRSKIIDTVRAEQIVIEAARKHAGVKHVFPRSMFQSHAALRGEAAHYARSYFEGRSADFIIQPHAGWTWGGTASHGTTYLADSRVPLAFYRGGRAPLVVAGPVETISLAPTLAQILGSAPPFAAEGAILTAVAEHLK